MRTPAITVEIARFVDDHQPGFVECRLLDARGKAQGHVRSRRQDPNALHRKDFEAVFRSVSRDHVEYMEINAAEATPSDGTPGMFRIGLQ